MHVALDNLAAGGEVLVQWWVPGKAKESIGGRGRRKQVADVFGPWHPLDSCSADEVRNVELPPVLVARGNVLMINVELEGGDRIPFKFFDELRTTHNIDVSALSLSSTHNGDLYRSYVLMRLADMDGAA